MNKPLADAEYMDALVAARYILGEPRSAPFPLNGPELLARLALYGRASAERQSPGITHQQEPFGFHKRGGSTINSNGEGWATVPRSPTVRVHEFANGVTKVTKTDEGGMETVRYSDPTDL